MTESDEIHRAIQEHFDKCATCQREVSAQKANPKPFGRRAAFCQVYYTIVEHYRPEERTMHDS